MGPFVIRAALTGFALWVVTRLVHGLDFVGGDNRLQRIGIIFVVAVIFGLVNAFIKPIVQILSIPLYILTLGLFHIVVNALMLWITARITAHTTHWAWRSTTSGGPRSRPPSCCRSSAGCCRWCSATYGAPPGADGTLETCPNCPKSKRWPTTFASTPSAGRSGASTSPRCRCSRPSTRRSTRCTAMTVTGADRWGKYLGLHAGELILITHLSRAGWLRWSEKLTAAPLKPGKGPIALRVHLGTPGEAPGFDLTEAGTQKRLAVWLVDDPKQVPGIAALGPDALELTADDLAGLLAGNTGRIKSVITDQKVIAGIGNAYSDEILHVAKLSPFATAGKLSEGQLAALHDAMVSVLTRCREPIGRPAGRNAQRARSGPGCGCTPAPACRARYAGTPCAKCRSPTSRFSTARPARPAARCWLTGGCRVC